MNIKLSTLLASFPLIGDVRCGWILQVSLMWMLFFRNGPTYCCIGIGIGLVVYVFSGVLRLRTASVMSVDSARVDAKSTHHKHWLFRQPLVSPSSCVPGNPLTRARWTRDRFAQTCFCLLLRRGAYLPLYCSQHVPCCCLEPHHSR